MKTQIIVPTMAEQMAQGKSPEYLFWVGSAGAFDDRYKKVSQAFVKVLHFLNVDYAVLGIEETDSGDIARRAGNEMLFQMQAFQNVTILNGYEVKKIITCDPHDYNTLKNEYPELGGKWQVEHHTEFLERMIQEGKLTFKTKANQTITYHDPCYLGRSNEVYDAPRRILEEMGYSIIEMRRNKSFALCCGAGGAQMFKEAEKGNKEVYMERTEEALETETKLIATACPFCMIMITDGLKYKNKEEEIKNLDIAEIIALRLEL
jgi:heterodisulfide reductase subunit D